jgi:aldose 1-epimerase
MAAHTLQNGQLVAVVLPEAGAGLARLDWISDGAIVPLFRPLDLAPGAAQPTPSQLACFPMLPWANRLAPDGFAFQDRQHVPPPNRPGEPCPIHGDGWQYPWTVDAQSAASVTLLLDRSEGAPFSYLARISYTLFGPALYVTISIINTGNAAMPFGAGLHPFFPRTEGVTLQAKTAQMWLGGADKLPQELVSIPVEFDFNAAKAPPAQALDNVFTGWNGRARIRCPASGLAMSISADMDYYIAYAPVGANFFCFEPVDHAINAHNLPGGAAANGLSLLAPGQELRRELCFSVAALE